jgi:hypothetical protein
MNSPVALGPSRPEMSESLPESGISENVEYLTKSES